MDCLDVHRLELLRSCSEHGAIKPSNGSIWTPSGSRAVWGRVGGGTTSVTYPSVMIR
jgi:hypothetical protein